MNSQDYYNEKDVVKSYDFRLLKRLIKYAKPFIVWFLISIILLFVITAGELIRPYLVKMVIDDHIISERVVGEDVPVDIQVTNSIRKENIKGIMNLGLIYLAVIIVIFIASYYQIIIMQYTGQKIIYNIRQNVFSHIQNLPVSFFDKTPTGRLVTRVTNDTNTLNEMYTSVFVNLFKDLFLIIGIIVVMLRLNTNLALITFTVIPFLFISAFVFKKFVRKAYRNVRMRLAKLNSFLFENISGMPLVQSFNNEEFKYDEFKSINKEYLNANFDHITYFAIFRPLMDLFQSIAIALLIWYGGRGVLDGSITFGVLFAFTYYIQQLFRPINEISEKYNILQSAMASSERIFELLDTKVFNHNKKTNIALNHLKGKIEFKNVFFAYNQDNWVLKDISFKIEPGETVAIAGYTGSGKTTIISLINRFYDIQKGEILIDGKNIKDFELSILRKNIGLVLQEVFIFAGNINKNIKLDSPNISDEDVINTANYVNANRFIDALPNKYFEEVKERGSTLSEGEKQLLAFARALAHNPKILILDEATSNIDTETERLIQNALEKISKNRTTIIVAHRLSTIKKADKIILLQEGKIKEFGTHSELINQDGYYKSFYRLQEKNSNQPL